MAYVIIGVIVLLAVFWIVTPLFLPNRAPVAAATTSAPESALRREELEEERDTLLRNLKELEFDLSMGKINDDEYAALRADLTARISRVLDRLEGFAGGSLNPAATGAGPSVASAAEASLEIEVLVARHRRGSANKPASP